jgi:hypothetical protein
MAFLAKIGGLTDELVEAVTLTSREVGRLMNYLEH